MWYTDTGQSNEKVFFCLCEKLLFAFVAAIVVVVIVVLFTVVNRMPVSRLNAIFIKRFRGIIINIMARTIYHYYAVVQKQHLFGRNFFVLYLYLSSHTIEFFIQFFRCGRTEQFRAMCEFQKPNEIWFLFYTHNWIKFSHFHYLLLGFAT